jgi:hypothetical protein
MGFVRVAGHSSIYKGAPHDGSDAVDQGVLNTAVGDVNYAVGTELKQAQLGRARPAPDGQPRAKPKPGSLPGNHRYLGQTVSARQFIERTARGRGDAALTEPRATRTWWAMWARRQCARLTLGHTVNDSVRSTRANGRVIEHTSAPAMHRIERYRLPS